MKIYWDGLYLNVYGMPYTNKAVKGQIALQLTNEGGPYCMATVAIADAVVPENAVIIKNYSENEGVLDALIYGGIIEPQAVTFVHSGHVTCPVHMLTAEAIEAVL